MTVTEDFNEKGIKLSSPDYHESIGVFPKWRIGDSAGGGLNEIYPFYDSDQCEEILDNVFGFSKWSCEYREVNGKMFCSILIDCPDGVKERMDAGGARKSRKKNLSEVEVQTFEAKTAATDAFVRAAARWGIGRHLSLLPKIRLKVQNGICFTPKGEQLKTPEELSAWCNQSSPAILHLIAAYNLCKDSLSSNEEMMQKLTDLRKFIESLRNEKSI